MHSFEILSQPTDELGGHLSKEQLWDMLQTTEAELRARLLQVEAERDHYAQQLHTNQPSSKLSHGYEAYESLAVSNVMSAAGSIYGEGGVHYDFGGSSQYDNNPYADVGNCHRSCRYKNSPSDNFFSKTNYFKDNDANDHRQSGFFIAEVPAEFGSNKNHLQVAPEDIVKKKRKVFHSSSGNIRADKGATSRRHGRKVRSRSQSRRRVQSCTSSSSDSTMDASYPTGSRRPSFPLKKLGKSLPAESSDSEINPRQKLKKSAARRRQKYRSCTSQPEAAKQRSDPNVNDVPELDSSSARTYGHLFRSMPDVDTLGEDDCTTIATEFVYSQSSLHEVFKAEDTEVGEFDDLSCIDIPAPKFEDTSSNEDLRRSESHTGPRTRQTSAANRYSFSKYPQYSGVFPAKDIPSSNWISAERKSVDAPNLSPLPILRSLHSQQSKQREQERQKREDSRQQQVPKQWPPFDPSYARKDGSSLASRLPEKKRRSTNADSWQQKTSEFSVPQNLRSAGIAHPREIYAVPREIMRTNEFSSRSLRRNPKCESPISSLGSSRRRPMRDRSFTRDEVSRNFDGFTSYSVDDSYLLRKDYAVRPKDTSLSMDHSHHEKFGKNWQSDRHSLREQHNNWGTQHLVGRPASQHWAHCYAAAAKPSCSKAQSLYSQTSLSYRDEFPQSLSASTTNQRKSTKSPYHSAASSIENKIVSTSLENVKNGSSSNSDMQSALHYVQDSSYEATTKV